MLLSLMLSLSSINFDDYFIFISVFRLIFSIFCYGFVIKILMDFIFTHASLYISKRFLSNGKDLDFFW